MRWHSLHLSAGFLSAALAFHTGALEVPSATDVPRQAEVARLRAHFDSVDAELRHAGALHLTPDQRLARATLIGWLREYRNAGAFPRNDRFQDPAPFFRDSHGALCAMAYLIQRSGREDIVDRIALTRNNALIAELADDAELVAWLDSVGFSVAEAARVQPTYERRVEVYVAMYDTAWSQRDSSTVAEILAQEYQYFTSRGGVSFREETLAMLTDPDYRLEHAARSEIVVTESDQVAIVSSRWEGRGSYRGRSFKDDQRCGQTWVRFEWGWRLLSEHCVQIAPENSGSD